MSLQSSGSISFSDIQNIFSRGYDLNSYRSTTWYTDAGGSGSFSGGSISFSEFYSKRSTFPYAVNSGWSNSSYSYANWGEPLGHMSSGLSFSSRWGTANSGGNGWISVNNSGVFSGNSVHSAGYISFYTSGSLIGYGSPGGITPSSWITYNAMTETFSGSTSGGCYGGNSYGYTSGGLMAFNYGGQTGTYISLH